MPQRNALAANPTSHPVIGRAPRSATCNAPRDPPSDRARIYAPRGAPRNPPSAEDIDRQIRSYFERGLV